MIRNALFGLTAASLAAAPVAAQAAAEPSRGSAPAAQESELRGQGTLFFLGAILAVAAGIYLLIDDDDEEAVSA